MSTDRISKHFEEAQSVLNDFFNDENLNKIKSAADLMVKSLKSKNKIISCGNGGSMCDSMHFSEELSGKFRNERAALPAISISDPSHISCVANDYGYDYVFSRFIEAFGKDGDVLLAISTSGNSKNVINAIKSAKSKNMIVIGLTGKDGGEMASLCDVELRAPLSKYADRAQELHIKIIHALIDYIEQELFFN